MDRGVSDLAPRIPLHFTYGRRDTNFIYSAASVPALGTLCGNDILRRIPLSVSICYFHVICAYSIFVVCFRFRVSGPQTGSTQAARQPGVAYQQDLRLSTSNVPVSTGSARRSPMSSGGSAVNGMDDLITVDSDE